MLALAVIFALQITPSRRVVSPNGRYVLSEMHSPSGMPTLLLSRHGFGRSLPLLDVRRSWTAAWNSKDTAFFINDQWASDRTQSFLYASDGTRLLDVSDAIVRADSAAAPFTSGHAYFSVSRWLHDRHILAKLTGHTDHGPVRCFTLCYRVSVAGRVRKISQRVEPVTVRACRS